MSTGPCLHHPARAQCIDETSVADTDAGAVMLAGCGKCEHATLGLRDVLQWLSVPQQIQFNIAFLAFICVRGAGPTCLPTRLHTDSSTNLSDRAGLRCAGCRDLAVLRTAMEVLRKRSFHVAAQVSSAVPCRLLYTGHRCCRQAASQVSHTATDGGATTSAIHCRTTSIRCAWPHSLELSAGRPPCTAGL